MIPHGSNSLVFVFVCLNNLRLTRSVCIRDDKDRKQGENRGKLHGDSREWACLWMWIVVCQVSNEFVANRKRNQRWCDHAKIPQYHEETTTIPSVSHISEGQDIELPLDFNPCK